MDLVNDDCEKSEVLPVLEFKPKETSSKANPNKSLVVRCLKCEKCNEFPKEKDDYLAHLFLEHRLVIADIDDIALLEDYLQYWHKEFDSHELEEFCTTMLLDQLPDGTPSKNEKYFLLSDILPKDFELRKNLKQQLLEKVVSQHQFERTDRNFTRECLFCRDVITGLRADYLEHLFTKHFIQLGRPENLVYVDELIEKLHHNLENLICLYCEKIFKDRVALKDHMRKKGHKRINPNNRDYDKYYLVNYRNDQVNSQRKTNRNHQEQRTFHRKPAHTQSNQNNITHAHNDTPISTVSTTDFERLKPSDESDSDWSDWEDDNDQLPPLNCLFCKVKESTYDGLKAHMSSHNVDFESEIKNLNFYQKIKLVNYVRRQICLNRCVTCNIRCETSDALLEHMSAEKHFGFGTQKQWDRPEFFFPTYEDDGLLCVLDDNPNDDVDETVVRIISEDPVAKVNKDAEKLSLENFKFL